MGTDPGRVTMHRLNRTEYNNTVRDLIGTTLQPATDFTADNRGAGFDNIADLLTLSPVQMAQYQQAAEALSEEALGPARARIVTCDVATGDACIRTALRGFAKRAWRRPVMDAELDPYMALVTSAKPQGDTVDFGLKLAVQALLISPDFLFRVETDPDPASLTPHPLSHHEIASRLSYFLWSSMPDDALFAAADASTLRDGKVLQAQITRMLADPKAQALTQNFAGQWLYTRIISDLAADKTLFPMFDTELKTAMRQETEMLFSDIAFNGTPADQLITGNFTYLNDRLAAHYGLPATGSKDLKKVTLSNNQRGGFMGQGTILASTSHPSRTSPVLRGKWVLEDLLCMDVPAPPPDVNTALPTPPPGSTFRQVLEAHKQKSCASCHKLMDPIGFGFENYDAIGRYRTMDNGQPIDSSGAYLDGKAFSGIKELGGMVAADPQFARCMASKLYTYALGRAPQDTAGHVDPSTLDVLAWQFAKGGFHFDSLLLNIVASDAFQKRRGEPVGGMP
jgi:hypothetical protein